ncbi:Protein of unknown function [Micromonospora lupini str. Lupac 08]|uniref:Uncharacterized protein n=1 Tax=Micromonospora lupini str. Lupac 08 TaxID=1150864 RepID=I0LCK9_9ACTN|nr:Protein of unknown function [Micromonospora lupini str. Lupac 08]
MVTPWRSGPADVGSAPRSDVHGEPGRRWGTDRRWGQGEEELRAPTPSHHHPRRQDPDSTPVDKPVDDPRTGPRRAGPGRAGPRRRRGEAGAGAGHRWHPLLCFNGRNTFGLQQLRPLKQSKGRAEGYRTSSASGCNAASPPGQ